MISKHKIKLFGKQAPDLIHTVTLSLTKQQKDNKRKKRITCMVRSLKNVTIHFTTKINDKKKLDVSMTACHHYQKLRNSHDLWSRFAQIETS